MSAQEELAQKLLQDRKRTSGRNNAFLLASFIACCIVIASYVVYFMFLVDMLVGPPSPSPLPVSESWVPRGKFAGNEEIEILIRYILPGLGVILSLYPLYVLVSSGFVDAVKGNEAKGYYQYARMIGLLVAMVVTAGPIVSATMMAFLEPPPEITSNLPENKQRKELFWCIFCVLVGLFLSILANLYAVRRAIQLSIAIVFAKYFKSIIVPLISAAGGSAITSYILLRLT